MGKETEDASAIETTSTRCKAGCQEGTIKLLQVSVLGQAMRSTQWGEGGRAQAVGDLSECFPRWLEAWACPVV